MDICNTYSGLIDDWKITLIDQRARRRGFRTNELSEVRQDIAMDLHQFQYDPTIGASERTALTSVIDRRLSTLIRTRVRRQAHEIVCAEFIEEEGVANDRVDPHHEQDLRQDLAPVLASMEPIERDICAGLADGASVRALSEALRLSRYEVSRTIERIRARFIAAGLQVWLVG